jgi:hypothetical protein
LSSGGETKLHKTPNKRNPELKKGNRRLAALAALTISGVFAFPSLLNQPWHSIPESNF